MGITTNQREGSVEKVEEVISHVAPREEPEQKASVSSTPPTLCSPTLAKDGTSVTGALKYHLKNRTSDRKLGIS